MRKQDIGGNATLLIVDAMAAKLTFENGDVFSLHSQEGFQEVGTLIKEEKLRVRKYKFIVLLFGRADLWEPDPTFKRAVSMCLEIIKDHNPKAIVVLTATLPSPGDAGKIIRTAKYRNSYLSRIAGDQLHLEFTRPGKQLIELHGPSLEFYDAFNNLNDEGLDTIRRALEAKFTCAKLACKYKELEKRRGS